MGNFRKNWILYNSIASVSALVTFYFWPITATLLIIIVQTVHLYKQVGPRALIWILNPVIFGFALFITRDNIVYSILGGSMALELVFFLVIGRFSKMIWTLIVGVPVLIAGIVFYLGLGDVWNILICIVICPILIWISEAYYLEFLFENNHHKNVRSINTEILDMP